MSVSNELPDKADLLTMAATIARLAREDVAKGLNVRGEILDRASKVLLRLSEPRHRGCGSDCMLPAGHLGPHVQSDNP